MILGRSEYWRGTGTYRSCSTSQSDAQRSHPRHGCRLRSRVDLGKSNNNRDYIPPREDVEVHRCGCHRRTKHPLRVKPVDSIPAVSAGAAPPTQGSEKVHPVRTLDRVSVGSSRLRVRELRRNPGGDRKEGHRTCGAQTNKAIAADREKPPRLNRTLSVARNAVVASDSMRPVFEKH